MADAGAGIDGTDRWAGARAASWALFGLALLLLLVGIALAVATRDAPAQVAYAIRGFEVVIGLPLAVTGFVLTRRLPGNPLGWLMAGVALLMGLLFTADGYAIAAIIAGWDLPAGPYAAWLVNWLWVPSVSALGVFVLLLYPDGRLPSPRWRPVAVFSVAATIVGIAATTLVDGPLESFRAADNPFGIDGFGPDRSEPLLGFQILAMIGGATALVVRFRRSNGVTRQQLKVMLFAGVVLAATMVVEAASQGIFGGGLTGQSAQAVQVALILALVGIPVAGGIAILRYGLYEIDVVLSKTLVYGVLAAFITVLYASIVAGASAVAGATDNRWLPLLAAAIVAVAFQPARERVQRVADRVVFGDRVSPYEVLSSFSAQIATTYETEEQLTQMARLLAEGTGAVRADVRLVVAGEERPGATWPVDPPVDLEPDLLVPVTHQGERLGVLVVTKARNDPLTPQEHKLAIDLAAQAGIALRNVGLTAELLARVEELRASRQRLVTAQDEERRRIERDLHDGAQQQLVALKIKLGLARMQAEDEGAEETAAQLAGLATEAGEALDTLRDLAHGIYPPLLAADGLVAALESHVRKSTLDADVVADDRGRRYPAEVEVAAYYCCLEAMQNATKYAGDGALTVSLRDEPGTLLFEVRDEGRGFEVGRVPAGAGLRNMTDRVEALAGSLLVRSAPGEGTTVAGRLPVPPAPQH